MTMPHLCNCPHDGDGWCIPCVKAMHKELEDLRERDQASREQLLARIKELEVALVQCIEAFEFTRQYVGYDTLPAIDGWSWFDAVNAARSVLTPIHVS